MERESLQDLLPSVSRALALAIVVVALALGAPSGCARWARGPPLQLDIALERARQALCTDGGVESPRALVAALAPEEPCPVGAVSARVRCYLAQPDTAIAVARIRGGVRVRFAIPRLSDHVHDVTVRERGGALTVEVDSRN